MPSGARTEILKLPAVGKVELLGTQDEVIYLDFSTQHARGLGIDQQAVLQSLQAQNAVAPSGVVQAGPQRVSLRVSGQFTSEESLREHQHPRARPLLPPGRRRHHQPRLRRPAAADVPLRRQAGDRARHRA